jgi:hypothetical protein
MGKGFGLGAARPVALRLSDSTLPETGEVALVMVQLNSRVSYSSRKEVFDGIPTLSKPACIHFEIY